MERQIKDGAGDGARLGLILKESKMSDNPFENFKQALFRLDASLTALQRENQKLVEIHAEMCEKIQEILSKKITIEGLNDKEKSNEER